MSDSHFDRNEHGVWCPSCGELIVPGWRLDDDELEEPIECTVCGYPDDLDAMQAFHVGEQP